MPAGARLTMRSARQDLPSAR